MYYANMITFIRIHFLILKTLFNIVEDLFKNCRTLMSVLYNDVQMDQ